MNKKKIYLLVAMLMCAGVASAQKPDVESRIAGLENNAEYLSLLREESQLQIREDSIVNAAEGLRRQLRNDPENRQQYTNDILKLESAIFDLRNSKGRIIDRINTIEQDWVLANLNNPAARTTPAGEQKPAEKADDKPKMRYLIDNLYFREHLTQDDYAELSSAQAMEFHAVDYVNTYFSNYQLTVGLAEAYESAATEAEATDLYDKLNALQSINRVLSDSLSTTWNYIFDNKNYAYSYLLDQLDKEDILVREEQQLADAARALSALRGEVESEAVADYFLRKKVLLDCETALAEVLGLAESCDSLKGVAAQLAAVDFRLPRIGVEKRVFIEYDTLVFSPKTQYTDAKPIPECRVYDRGTIYRVLLGTFSAKRPVSVFRGVYPLAYIIDAEGKWCYYAGGFATKAGAEAAQKALKARGFARPEIVVWNDGVYRNLSRDGDASVAWRVEISGVESLSAAVKEAITETSGGAELSRVGQSLFVVGVFDDKTVADQVLTAVVQAEPGIEIKVAEIAK